MKNMQMCFLLGGKCRSHSAQEEIRHVHPLFVYNNIIMCHVSLLQCFPPFCLCSLGPEELLEFRRVLTSQLMFGIMEHHMWLSLWERPSHSRFTRGQRVTCSAIILHLYLALGALWYGAVGTKGHR